MTTIDIGHADGLRKIKLTDLPHDGSLTDWATATLLATIRDNQLKSGTKLPTEQVLCEALDVSRTVVREAIARLKAEGRLTSRRGSGIFVADPPLTNSPLLGTPQNLAEILDMLELRLAVEVEAASLAASRMTAQGLIELDNAMRGFEDSVVNWQGASDADFAFHTAVARASGNPQFVRFLEGIRATAIPRRSLDAQFPDADARTEYLRRLTLEHEAIHDAIVDRDPETAAATMRTHLEGSRRRYRRWSSRTEKVSTPDQGKSTA
ncbi:FadR/GntR family transcriptional regulator (plasmid) [Falsihalocynthiibacter sp. SS001]|uniref:FadR/GntR family transcriptional regulator n=1 Tax=Falsihalocynthiibacter sp. SS001 TaxID=3349698 RepID=UPI0036D4109D